MNLSSYIKALRDKKGLTQEQAANELGVTTQTIMNWENNRSTPDMHNVKNISRVYGVDMIELLKKMAEEVDGSDCEQTDEVINTCPWTDLLPNNFDYEKLENLRLTQQEAKMLINIEFASSFCGDLANIVSQEFDNKVEAVDIIDRLTSLNLCKLQDDGHEFAQRLTRLGHQCYRLIKSDNLFLRNIYKLPFKEFISVCNKLEFFDMKLGEYNYVNLVSFLERFNEGTIPLDAYEKSYNHYKVNKYGFEKKSLKSGIFEPGNEIYDEIMNQFYTIEETDWDNNEYLVDKEAYIKKVQFFEENKESIEDLKLPSPVPLETIRKAVPTQKTIDFLAKLNEQ